MSKSGIALIAANSVLFAIAFIGFATTDEEALFPAALLAMVLAVINSVALYRRSTREPSERRSGRASGVDEMDARTVLDIDARLEALERREREMEEAGRIRQMVSRGQQSEPSEPLAEAPRTNGRRDRA